MQRIDETILTRHQIKKSVTELKRAIEVIKTMNEKQNIIPLFF